jgi:Flp pilus assembly protein TadG
MMKSRKRITKRRGAAAVEFALVLPVYMVLLLGVLEFARLGMAVQVVTSAAREGCRVAALPGNTATDAQNRVNAVLSQSGFPNATITLTPADPTTASGGTQITLSLSIPFSQLSWLGTASFANTNIHGSATFASERP